MDHVVVNTGHVQIELLLRSRIVDADGEEVHIAAGQCIQSQIGDVSLGDNSIYATSVIITVA